MLERAERGSVPRTPSTWLFGEGGNVEVWAVDGDRRLWASVMIAPEGSIILLNRCIAGSEHEIGCLNWAFHHIAMGSRGFFVLAGR